MTRRIRQAMMLVGLSLLLVVASLPLGSSNASAATVFSNVSLNTTTPAQYDKFEVKFDLSATYTNPFNPDEVDVRAYFTTPTGQTEVMPGFYNSNSSPKWAVRYAPRQTGAYSVVIKVTDGNGLGQSSTYSFTAGGPGSNRGFMGVNGNRFVDSYGKQLTLIGTNYAWGAPSEILAAMPEYKAAKMNLMRVWFSVWWGNYAAEWGPTVTTQNGITMSYDGIGKYQLENMARMDTLMDTAAANDIYVMLTLNSFGDFYYDWPQNAYNTANGGPSSWTENNTDFWTNATAINYQKKLLRYIFARWGYSRALGMMEYWNESDNRVDTDASTRASWHSAVDGFWKGWDFYDHPTTTSFAWKDHQEFNQTTWETLPTMDVTNYHQYDSSSNVVDKWETELKHFIADFDNRPAFIGEYGISGGGEDPNDAGVQRYTHDGLWAPIFRAGAAGGNLFWEFAGTTGFNVPANIKAQHTALANFVQPVEQYLINMPFVDYGAQSNSIKVGGYKTADRALLWINDTQSNWTVGSPRSVSGMSFTVPGMNNGTYDITYYNTYTGTNISTTTASVASGNLVLGSIPSFTRDIAVKAVHQGGGGGSDTQAPTVPTNLTSPSKTDTSVNLSWSAATDNVGVTGYDVYRGSSLAGSTSGAGATTFTATGLTANTAYSFTVKAKDAAGNVSGASGALNVTTDASSGANWVFCASENNTCSFSGTKEVRYGANGSYNYGTYTNSVFCGNSTFGDPISGTLKTCDVNMGSGGGGSGSITREYWTGISGTSIANIPLSTAPSGTDTLTSLEGPTNWADNYGTRIRGYITPSTTGSYTFWIAGDDDSELWLSTDGNPANKVKIAYITGWAGPRAWTTNATQQSAAKSLTGGQQYYVEVLHKEGSGGDNIAVGWTGPGISTTTVIDGSYLSPFAGDTGAPTAPTGLTSPSKTDTTVNLSWTASTDNVGVTGYDVYKGGVLDGSTMGATTYTASGLTASTAYSFTVKAKDAAGNVSAASGALNVTTEAASSSSGNLLLNAGFETDNGSGKPSSWVYEQDYYAFRDISVKRSGSASLRISGTTGPWFGWYQDVNATAGNTYTFDGYVNITANTGSKLWIKVQFFNSAGTLLADNSAASYDGTTTSGFVNVHGAYTAPANTAKVRIYPYFNDMRGTFYFDDFSLTSGS